MTKDDLLEKITFGNECKEILHSAPWKIVAHRKAQIAGMMLHKPDMKPGELETLRARYEELQAVQRWLRNGVEEARQAEAEVVRQ